MVWCGSWCVSWCVSWSCDVVTGGVVWCGVIAGGVFSAQDPVPGTQTANRGW